MNKGKVMRINRALISLYLLGAAGITAGYLPSAMGGNTTGLFKFKAIFMGGTCSVSAPSKVVFNGGTAISSQDIENTPPEESFPLTLSGCAGWGGMPSITVSGESTSLYGPALFRNPSPDSSSDGYGILLKTAGNTYFKANANLAQNKTIDAATTWQTTNQLSLINGDLPMTAVLTCGDCTLNGRKGGDLVATVTFDFTYE